MEVSMGKKVILREVAQKAHQLEAKRLRSALFEDCRSLVTELEGDVSGYALVAWTQQGELRSAYHTGKGPLRPALIPVLVQDALSRLVAQELAAPAKLGESE
jgi:hypothetical protein